MTASTLMPIGLKRNEAKIIFYLLRSNEATSREIEIECNLRQPEVSNAIREIRNRGLDWITERNGKNPKRGRPYRVYTLNTNPSEIIDYLKKEKEEEFKTSMSLIDALTSEAQA